MNSVIRIRRCLGTLYTNPLWAVSKVLIVPRATLHPILASRMGRDHYVSKVTKLRENPQVRDFEVFRETNHRKRKMGLPEVYFDHTFIDFLKDNYSRILRAIDKDPGLETHNTISR